MVEQVKEDSTSNSFNPVEVERWVKEIERHHDSLLTERMSYMGRCRPIRENIAECYDLAYNKLGIPKKVLKAKIKERDLRRQIDGIPQDFEEGDRETYEQVSQALGDFGELPLGMAAKQRAARGEAREEPAPTPEEPAQKRPRGRSRKSPSPDTPAGIDPQAASESDHPIYQSGFDARIAEEGAAIPDEHKGVDRDRWHAGWLAADAKVIAEQNAERLNAGIKGMPGAEAPGKVTIQ